MGSSDYIQVPIHELTTIASKLSIVKADVESTEPLAEGLNGSDKIHGTRIVSAVEEFFDQWKRSRLRLLENVGILGEVSSGIANTTGDFDNETASQLHDFAANFTSGAEE